MAVWVLTDGKAGDEVPCLGVAEELVGARGTPLETVVPPPTDPKARYPASFVRRTYPGGSIDIRRVLPGAPWVWLMPHGPIDPRHAPARPDSPLSPPWPDVLIASGRRSIAYVREIKRLSGGKTFTVVLKDPRTHRHGADFVWVPEHDRTREPAYMRTLTTPHRLSEARIAVARAGLSDQLLSMPSPRVGILLGGRTRRGPFSAADRIELCHRLEIVSAAAGSFLVTVSRRTPPNLLQAVEKAIAGRPAFVWDGTGLNPYLDLLAAADAIIATGDSHTMISEAAATGAPLMIFPPSCVKPKLTYFGQRMFEEGWARLFDGSLHLFRPTPHDATATVAAEITRQRAMARATLPVDACPHGPHFQADRLQDLKETE